MVAKFLSKFLHGCSLSQLDLYDKKHGTIQCEQTSGCYQAPGKHLFYLCHPDRHLSNLLKTHKDFTALCLSDSLFLELESFFLLSSLNFFFCCFSLLLSSTSGLTNADAYRPLPSTLEWLPLQILVVFPLIKACDKDGEVCI